MNRSKPLPPLSPRRRSGQPRACEPWRAAHAFRAACEDIPTGSWLLKPCPVSVDSFADSVYTCGRGGAVDVAGANGRRGRERGTSMAEALDVALYLIRLAAQE